MIFSQELIKNIGNRIKELQKIQKELEGTDAPVPTIDKDFVKKLKEKLQKKIFPSNYSNRECRTLCSIIGEIAGSKEEFNQVQEILKTNWKDSFIKRLLGHSLRNWYSLQNNEVYKLAHDFFISKLEEYEENDEKILHWKVIREYFKSSNTSEISISKELLKTKSGIFPIKEIPSQLKLPENYIQTEYFQQLTIQFYHDYGKMTDDFEDIMNNSCNSDDTIKIVVSDLICQTSNDSNQQKKLEDYALKKIGHPFLKQKWFISTDKYGPKIKELVENGRKTLSKWLIGKYIKDVFEILMPDETRKEFWLKYENDIEEIRIAGQVSKKNDIKIKLESIDSLKNSVNDILIECTYCDSSSECAFLIKMKDAIFAEFSGIGSVYAYKRDGISSEELARKVPPSKEKVLDRKEFYNKIEQRFEEKHLNKNIRYFKNMVSNTARITHNGNKWKKTLREWIEKELNIYV